MPDQSNSIQDAVTKALIGSTLYSVLLTPISVQPANAFVLQPGLDKKTEYIRAIPSLENPCFDQNVLLKSRSDATVLAIEFEKLVRKWKEERPASSSSIAIVIDPSYQRIISLGTPVLPLILRELARETDHWFWALRVISGVDPVAPQDRGKIKKMAAAWLEWGHDKGYV